MFAMASCVSRARLDGHPRSSMGTSTPHAWTIRVRPGVPRSDEDGALGEEKSLHLHSKEDFKSSIIRSELGVGAAERVARRLRSLVYRNSAGHPRRSAIRDGGSGRRSDLPPAPYQPGHVRVRLRARAAPLLRGCRGGCRAPERAQDSRTSARQTHEDSSEHQCGVLVRAALPTAPASRAARQIPRSLTSVFKFPPAGRARCRWRGRLRRDARFATRSRNARLTCSTSRVRRVAVLLTHARTNRRDIVDRVSRRRNTRSRSGRGSPAPAPPRSRPPVPQGEPAAPAAAR